MAMALVVGTKPALAAFPGANGKVVFMSNRDGDSEIYTISPNGSNLARLTKNEGTQDGFAAWSSDGNKVAFVRQPACCIGVSFISVKKSEIYKMNGDGSNKARLTNNTMPDLYPAWSPSGGKIVFASKQGSGKFGLFTMRADSSGREKILGPGDDLPGDDFFFGVGVGSDERSGSNPSWSPDGTKIAYSTSSTSGSTRTWVLNFDAEKQPVGIPTLLGTGSNAAWSPDGTKIVYEGWSTIKKQSADASSSSIPLFGCGCHEKYFHSSDWQPRP
jgi:Tol biopolymer transport system component